MCQKKCSSAIILLLLCAAFCSILSRPQAILAAEETQSSSFTAIISSDLHYTVSSSVSNLVIPCMSLVREMTDALIDEVIDRKPDVFILTGDNTNSGDAASEEELAQKLTRVTSAGIRVVMTTGNHDFDHSDAEEYASHFSRFMMASDRAPSSLSYVTLVGGTALLAMDDSSATLGQKGWFSRETMAWLKEMLEKYADYPKIFLSHHSVVLGADQSGSASYRIQNEELLPLLQSYGVRLVLCGHLHSQNISESDGTYEILSAMPISGNHYIGFLTVQDGQADYHTEPIDFAAYAPKEISGEIARLDGEYGNFYRNSISSLIARSGYDEAMQEQILELVKRFFVYYADGTMAEHRQEILDDPAYKPMIDALWDYNYGPWMASSMENKMMIANRLNIPFP